MKTKNIFIRMLIVLVVTTAFSSCMNGDLVDNPNASSTATPTIVLNRLTSSMVLSDEKPFGSSHRVNQFYVSNYSYYWGSNYYNWTNTGDQYDLLKYAILLEKEAYNQYGSEKNVFQALAKFYRAYSAVWLSQRVGDIPLSEAGSTTNLTPKYDTQKEVYSEVMDLLDSANVIMGNLITKTSTNSVTGSAVLSSTGDIFGLTNLQWQKAINTFRLRVLISMSNRADDNSDLNIKEQFATILNDPTTYPIMTSNSDNMVYRFNASYNPYPAYSNKSYTYGANVGKTLLDITTASNDPRTYIFATPAPAQYKTAGKAISDFSAYVGASTNTTQAVLYAGTDANGTSTSSDGGSYSYLNYIRYFASQSGANAEAYIVLGYPEMCFNIAEAIARGWVSGGDAEAWYYKGINASLGVYGLTDGGSVTVGDRLGATLGTVTVSTSSFLSNANIVYKGDNDEGIEQILTQKYVAFFCNSGYEAFYNWLRTGYPAFQEGGAGIGTATNKIPRRWMYPADEINYNSENYQSAIQSQYGGTDDVTQDTWLFK